MMRNFIRCSVLLSLVAVFGACSSQEKTSDTPDGLYAIAEDLEKSERYELAIQKYTEVKNKFPYSAFATKAELAVADVHYKAESWPEAQVAYQTFRELHPTHPKIAYVIHRVGLSIYNQLPETVDRDLTLSKDAIAAFDDVIKRFPQSEYYDDARVKKDECLKKLAGKELYIGEFYFKREQFDSALPRFENVFKKYPGFSYDAEALSKAAIAAKKSSQADKARRYLGILAQKYPNSPELAAAQKEVP